MKVIDTKNGMEIKVGDIIRRKDYKGRWRSWRVDEVRPHDILATELKEDTLFSITTVISLSALGLACSLF